MIIVLMIIKLIRFFTHSSPVLKYKKVEVQNHPAIPQY